MTQNAKAANLARKNELLASAAKTDAEFATMKEAARQAFFDTAEAMGKAEAEAEQGQITAGILFNDGIRMKFLAFGDGKEFYLRWKAGRKAAQANGTVDVRGRKVRVTGDNDAGQKVISFEEAKKKDKAAKQALRTNVSNFASFGRPAVVALGLEYFEKVAELRGQITAENRAQDDMLTAYQRCNSAVSRYADKAKKTQADFDAGKFTLAEVEAVLIETLTAADAETAALIERFAKQIAALVKLDKGDNAGQIDGLTGIIEDLKMAELCHRQGRAFPRKVEGLIVGEAERNVIKAEAEQAEAEQIAEAAKRNAEAAKAEAEAETQRKVEAAKAKRKAAKAEAAKAKAEAEAKAKAEAGRKAEAEAKAIEALGVATAETAISAALARAATVKQAVAA